MKLLVTGGLGFIGSNFIIQQIQKINNSVINVDKITYAGNKNNLRSIEKHKNYHFIQGDICSNDLIENIFNKHKPDCVVNFAAESHVDRSIDSPMDFAQTNVIGTVNLLINSTKYIKSSKKEKEFKFLHVSTDEVFGSLSEDGFFQENTPYDPSSPYSASKASSDHFVRSWNRTFNLPTLITNCSNNYGPRQFPEKLIPLMIINCLKEKPLPVYGSGKNIRDWLYVDDHCEAIYEVLKKGHIGHTYNIGGDNEITNLDIVNQICLIMDKERPRDSGKSYTNLIEFVEDRPGHDFRYAINASKIKNELNWHPSENFESGLRKTISWYLNNEEWTQDLERKYKQSRLGLSS